MKFRRILAGLSISAAWLLISPDARSQLTYSKGQIVSPSYEGWEKNADGSFNLLFGYMNSNWEEEFDIPVGPDNRIEPGGPDRGQPTHFFPRRNRFVFRIQVPQDFGKQEVVWSLTTHDKTVKAYATLHQDYFIDNMVLTSESGSIGSGVTTPEIRANKNPVLEAAGDRNRIVRVGETLELAAHVTDDGVPKARQRGGGDRRSRPDVKDLRLLPPEMVTVASATGLWVACYKFRGPGNVVFSPQQAKVWEDTRVNTNSQWSPLWSAPPAPAGNNWRVQVTFDRPGSYVLRWHASDGALWSDQDINVNVNP